MEETLLKPDEICCGVKWKKKKGRKIDIECLINVAIKQDRKIFICAFYKKQIEKIIILYVETIATNLLCHSYIFFFFALLFYPTFSFY